MLRRLDVVGVGLALAAVTCVALPRIIVTEPGQATLAAGLPTLLFGMVWASQLRRRDTTLIVNHVVRYGWALSAPLAMANAAVAAAIRFGLSRRGFDVGSAALGFLLGATAGALVWIPALLLTLLFFGMPLAWAQRQSERGLAGEERGELVVGLCVALLSLAALLVGSHRLLTYDPPQTQFDWMGSLHWPTAERLGRQLLVSLAALGLATGTATSLLSLARELRRRRFVARVEAGQQPGFRVDATGEGKVLVRETPAGHESYRVADLDEELFARCPGPRRPARPPRVGGGGPTSRAVAPWC